MTRLFRLRLRHAAGVAAIAAWPATSTLAAAPAAVDSARAAASARPSPDAIRPAFAAAGEGASAPSSRSEPGSGARFDLVVNNASAPQVFMQIASGTPYNMLVSPDVAGTLSITLRDTTVLEALESLREMFGYDFRITGNRVFVYPNTVQTRLYRLNYLAGRRQGASDIRVTSSSIAQSGSTGTTGGTGVPAVPSPGGSTGGSTQRADDNASIRTTTDADFWRDAQASLSMLVGNRDGRSVVFNTAAGVIVVRAAPAELRQVEQYLKAVQVSIERQVMLEAKIVEVELSSDAQNGINWGAFGRAFGNAKATIGLGGPGVSLGPTGALVGSDGNSVTPGSALSTNGNGRGFYGLALQSPNFAALLNFLETQGSVQVLSSPRIATLNNQKAVLKVGSDELYVTGVSTTTTTGAISGAISTPSLTLTPYFSGIALDVTPQIDDAGQVMLHIHPSVSSVAEKTKNVDLGSLGSFHLPLAASSVNETDSMVKVRDGQIVAIGGLMKQQWQDERTGLPVLQDVPVVGGLFRQTGIVGVKRELVIMLKPTVIRDDAEWPNETAFAMPPMPMPASTKK